MNILLIRSDVNMSGPPKLMHAYARALRSVGHNVVIASGGGDYAIELENDGFEHVAVNGLQIASRTALTVPIAIYSIARLLSRKEIAVAHSFNAHAGLLTRLADPIGKVRHFNTVLGTGKEWANVALTVLGGRIIAVSEDVRRRLIAAKVAAKNIRVVYNSTLDDRFFREVPTRPTKDRVHFCSIAMFTGNKGQEHILPRFAELAARIDVPMTLTLVGDGPSREKCISMAQELGIEKLVSFPGKLVDVVPELDYADIFIHLPTSETFGIVLCEAMARSLPVISLRVGGIPEVVEDNKSGILIDTRQNTSAILAAMERLARDADLRVRMGRRGNSIAESRFSLDALKRDLEQLYIE